MGYLNEDGLATLVGKVKGQVVQLTSEEYRNLPATKETDNKIYFVTDEEYAREIDDEPTLNSDHFVKSGGVYTYTSKIGSGTLTTTAQTIIPAINELDAAIDELNSGLITTRSFTKTIGESVSSGGVKSYTIPVSLSGYRALGIIQISGSGTGNFAFQDQSLINDATTANIYVRNVSSNAATINSLNIVVLYIKA